jgi:hypothetical protein
MGMDVTQWGMHYPHQRKIAECLKDSSGGFEYGTSVV